MALKSLNEQERAAIAWLVPRPAHGVKRASRRDDAPRGRDARLEELRGEAHIELSEKRDARARALRAQTARG
jgi:hypothetical protein